MLCAECKRTIPKYKEPKVKTLKVLCHTCQHARSRALQMRIGKRPEAKQLWEQLQKEKQEEKETRRIQKEYNTDALLSWLEKK